MPPYASHKPQLYEYSSTSDLLYALGFCAFIFILSLGALTSLILWEQAVIQSILAHSDFYKLLLPIKFVLGGATLIIFLLCLLVVRMATALMIERNRKTLRLLELIGASDDYITNGFYRRAFKPNLLATIIGAVSGCALLWMASAYMQYIFANTHSLLPGIKAIGFWYLLLLLATVAIFGVMLIFGISHAVRKFLHQNF